MPILSIRISADLHERFLAECERRDLKPAEFHRQAIERIVDHMADADLTHRPEPRVNMITPETIKAIERGNARAARSATATGLGRVLGFTVEGEPLYARQASRLKPEGKK